MSYIFVHDEKQIERFAEMFLPVLQQGNKEVLMVYMAARRKYDPSQHGATCFNRQIIRNHNINRFLATIKSYQTPLGTYLNSRDEPIPNKALVIYMILNPRNMVTASTQFSQTITSILEKEIVHPSSQNFTRVLSDFKSCVHGCKGRKLYFELDIDTKEYKIVFNIISFIHMFKKFAICVIETHGGYHVVYDNTKISKQAKASIWKEFNKPEYKFTDIDHSGKKIIKNYVDVRSDPSPPIPGTIQGGFNVYMYDNYNDWVNMFIN